MIQTTGLNELMNLIREKI